MNVGVGDIVLLGTLTWKLYKQCKESSSEFKRLSSEVASLHVVIKEIEENVEESKGEGQTLSPSRVARLAILIDGCKELLGELQQLLSNYESLGTQAQRTWDRLKWGLEGQADLRSRIINHATLLTAFNSCLTNSSTTRIEKRLNKFIEEVRSGLREGSVVTTSDVVANIESDDIWHQLRRELEDVGISASVVEEHHAYICNWLKLAISEGMLEETTPPPNLPMKGSIDSGYGGSSGSTYASSMASIARANQDFESQLVQNPSRMAEPLPRSNARLRKASSVSSVIFKLFNKTTAIIEAASDGDAVKVERLISLGASVNARDRWGWSALSMCAYGGHVQICRTLLDHGADMDNVDVDGDTPETLATHRGHAAIVIMLEEERAARDLKVREDCDEKPRSVVQ